MAKEKIDVTKIEGYDTMSAEEKVTALEGYEFEIPQPDYTGYVKQEIADKYASEASSWKKKFRDTQSETERREAEIAEQRQAEQEELAGLRRERDISKLTNSFLNLGYGDELAKSSAIAQLDGDTETLFKNQQKQLEIVRAEMRNKAQNDTPAPIVNNKNTNQNADTKKMSLAERQALFEAEGKSAFEE